MANCRFPEEYGSLQLAVSADLAVGRSVLAGTGTGISVAAYANMKPRRLLYRLLLNRTYITGVSIVMSSGRELPQ